MCVCMYCSESVKAARHKCMLDLPKVNPLESRGNNTCNATSIWCWYTGRRWVDCYIWYSEEGTGRGFSVQSTHQLPVYQSPYRCIMVDRFAFLMCPYRVKELRAEWASGRLENALRGFQKEVVKTQRTARTTAERTGVSVANLLWIIVELFYQYDPVYCLCVIHGGWLSSYVSTAGLQCKLWCRCTQEKLFQLSGLQCELRLILECLDNGTPDKLRILHRVTLCGWLVLFYDPFHRRV